MRVKENYHEILGNAQKTVHSVFRITDRGIEIDNGKAVLIEGDLKLGSLREGMTVLKRARENLSDCLYKLEQVEKIREIAKSGELSGGTADDVEDRLNYISCLMKALERTIRYLDISQILEKEAIVAIRELVDIVTGGKPAPPITITVEYII